MQGGGGALVIPEGAGLAAPEGADRLLIRLGQVEVQGVPAPLAEQTEAIIAPLRGRTMTAATIFGAAQALEQAYARAGYVLVRVVLPAQDLQDGGTLRLVVINGRIGQLDTSRLPGTIRSRIEAVLAPLVGREGVTLDQIERGLLLAGDTPGTVLRSALAPGDQPGTSVLVIEARYRLLTGFLSLDNSLSESLGRYTAGLGLDLNSPTGHGELAYLRAGGYPNGRANGFTRSEPRNRALAGGLIVPLGTDGLNFNVEATNSRATPEPIPGALNFTSDFTRTSFRLRYPAVRSRALTINTELAFDAQDEELRAVSPVQVPLSLDRLRILRASVDGNAVLPGEGVAAWRLTGSSGLDILGARGPRDATPDLPLSRQGSAPDFQKLDLTLTFRRPLDDHLLVQLDGRAQAAFGQALPRSEQIGLAGPYALSSFPAGFLQGDSGYVLRGEVQAPYPFAAPASLFAGTVAVAPYLFGAFGQLRLNQPTAQERRTVRAASYGLGVRAGAAREASFTNVGLTFEWGRQFRSDRPDRGDRISFTALIRF